MSKYHARRCVVDGQRFDSQREAARWRKLRLLEAAGEIRDLTRQPRFALDVRDVTIGHYVADFQYRERDAWVIEDSKGVRTALYRWKRKHMAAQYGITIRET